MIPNEASLWIAPSDLAGTLLASPIRGRDLRAVAGIAAEGGS
jgi:hypothetical protein